MYRLRKDSQQGFGHVGIILAIVVVIVVGSIGVFVWKKHQGNKIDVHAASTGYKYGVVLRYDAYATIYACRFSNAVSVLAIRNTTNPSSRYWLDNQYIGWREGPAGTSPSRPGNVVFRGGHAPGQHGSWLYNMYLTKISTVVSGHNYVGYASNFLYVLSDNRYSNSLNLVHKNAPNNQFRGRYVYTTGNGNADGRYSAYPVIADLPACHY